MGDNGGEYMLRTDFLPEEGLIYLDGSALGWVCRREERTWDYDSVALIRIKSFRNVFMKRGGVLTSPGVLREIDCERKRRKFAKGSLKRSRRRLRNIGGHSKGFGVSAKSFDKGKEWTKVYNSLYDMLVRNIEEHGPRAMVSPGDVRKYVGTRGKLSIEDKGLVYSALVEGNGVGILSADYPLLRAYARGSVIFGLSDTFVCDAMRGETFSACDWLD